MATTSTFSSCWVALAALKQEPSNLLQLSAYGWIVLTKAMADKTAILDEDIFPLGV